MKLYVISSEDKEEDFETKTLYERLQENRELKRLEIEEQFRYSEFVKSLVKFRFQLDLCTL